MNNFKIVFDDVISQKAGDKCFQNYLKQGQVCRNCSICKMYFVQKSRFDRFCDNCRTDNEVYRYSDWATYS